MTDEERKLALYCLKASSDYHSEVCEECIKYPNCDHTGRDDVIETIIEALEQEPKWIPVSERLPKSCGMYIVTRKIYDCPDTEPIIMSDESWFDGQNTWHNDNRINHERGYLSDVIAWMPLPETYKAENEVESEDKE